MTILPLAKAGGFSFVASLVGSHGPQPEAPAYGTHARYGRGFDLLSPLTR